MRVLKAVDAPVEGLIFSPDGRAIAASLRNMGVYFWNLDVAVPSYVRFQELERLDRNGGPVFSADGQSLRWSVQRVLRTYDRESRQTSSDTTFLYKGANHIVFTADGLQVISRHGMPDYRLIGWRYADNMWVQMWSLSTADRAVDSLSLSADGRLLAMLCRPALEPRWAEKAFQLKVHDARTNADRGSGDYGYKVEAKKLLFSPEARQLVGLNGMTLLVWSIPDSGNLGSPKLVQNTSRKSFTGMAYHPNGRRLFVSSNGEETGAATLQVFDTVTWNRTEQFTWNLGNLKSVAVSPDGTLAAAGSDHGEIVLWDVDV